MRRGWLLGLAAAVLFCAVCSAEDQTCVLKLGVADYVQMVLRQNESLQAAELEWQISRESIRNARAIFEPDFVGSYQHQKTKKAYTKEDQAYYMFYSFKDRDESDLFKIVDPKPVVEDESFLDLDDVERYQVLGLSGKNEESDELVSRRL